jgi:hypothetical protein
LGLAKELGILEFLPKSQNLASNKLAKLVGKLGYT